MDAKAAKNKQIKESMRATKARHGEMRCRVYEVKVVKNKLSKQKKDSLDQLFREGKWLRNSELAKGYDNMDRNAKVATVKVGDVFEDRPLVLLGSQMKQDIVDSIKRDIRGLATKKQQGKKVGRLKFKSYCNSIPLRQYGTTYRIDFANHTVSIQNMAKLPIKVRGLKQIPGDAEIANAKLVRKASGYYFHITVFEKREPDVLTGAVCGIDFGIGHTLTFDNDDKVDICVPETKAVKLASKRVNKSHHRNGKKKTNNHRKRVHKLQVDYEKLTNKKNDLAYKTVHTIVEKHNLIVIQDELITQWHKGLFGKQVQHSAMGTIKKRLKSNPKTYVIESSFPSTQICPVCGEKTKHDLSQREYLCQYCGYHHPSRDAKSAASLLEEALYRLKVAT